MTRSSSERRENPTQPDEPLSPEALDTFMDIGRRLVAQIAEECFRGVTAGSDRSAIEIETAAENVLGRIEVNARDLLIGQGADPDGEQWSLVWGATERRYRERLAELMIEAGYWHTTPTH